jgi:hypothetical protein
MSQDVSISWEILPYTSISCSPPCSPEVVDDASVSLRFLYLRPLLLAEIFSSRFLSSAYSTRRLVLICVMSHWIPRMYLVNFVNEQLTVLTSSSSFYCSFLKAVRLRSISSIFLFKLLSPDMAPCWLMGCYPVWFEPP